MKKFLFIISIFFVATTLTGCGESRPSSQEFILLSVITTEQGAIGQSLNFSVGSNRLRQEGVSEDQITDFKAKLKNNISQFRDEFLLNFMLIYNGAPNPNYKIGQGVVVTKAEYNETNDTIGFNIVFASNEAWQFYHPSTAESGDPQIDYSFFITYSSSGEFPFAGRVGDKMVAERYFEAYKNILPANIDYNPDLIYDYGTPSRYLKANSDYAFEEKGIYHNVWVRKMDNYNSAQITFYNTILNSGLWMLCLLLLTMFGLGVALIIIRIKKKRG